MRYRRLWLKAHLYIGLFVGPLIVLVSLPGRVAVFIAGLVPLVLYPTGILNPGVLIP